MQKIKQCGRCGAEGETPHVPDCRGRKVAVRRYTDEDYAIAREAGFSAAPENIRTYDNGGESADRYTLVRTTPTGFVYGRNGWRGCYIYGASSAHPFHPQGIGMTCEADDRPLWNAGKWGGDVGRPEKDKPIRWNNIPADVRKFAWQLAID